MSALRSPAARELVRKPALDRIVETAIWLQSESLRAAREQCARHGITATQLNVLKLVQTVGEISLSELSRKLSATNSSITGLVDRMVESSLVTREQSAEDRRVWKIKLTPDGRAMARKVDVAPWELLRGAIGALPAHELQQLTQTLLKVVDHIERSVTRGAKETK